MDMSREPVNEAPPLIEVQRLCKTVRDATGELPILRDVSFALAQRQTAAIVGASGSGKSTLLSLIAGLDVPSSGTVRIAGQDLFAVDEDARAAIRARRLGFVFQNFQLVGGIDLIEDSDGKGQLIFGGRAKPGILNAAGSANTWYSADAANGTFIARRKGTDLLLRSEKNGTAIIAGFFMKAVKKGTVWNYLGITLDDKVAKATSYRLLSGDSRPEIEKDASGRERYKNTWDNRDAAGKIIGGGAQKTTSSAVRRKTKRYSDTAGTICLTAAWGTIGLRAGRAATCCLAAAVRTRFTAGRGMILFPPTAGGGGRCGKRRRIHGKCPPMVGQCCLPRR